LLQIDPESLQAAVDRGEAIVQTTESGLEQARVAVESARVNLELAQDNLGRQQELWELRLVSREAYDQARREVELRETEYRAREVEVTTATQRIRQERATLDSVQYDLTQVTITSPIHGIVTRRNIEEGETVVIGTMNNPGTVLMTVADFAVLEAHVEVDETDIPSVRIMAVSSPRSEIARSRKRTRVDRKPRTSRSSSHSMVMSPMFDPALRRPLISRQPPARRSLRSRSSRRRSVTSAKTTRGRDPTTRSPPRSAHQ
jgi:multidrug efflux pump subunit AcrA (membrane-fusion protein)